MNDPRIEESFTDAATISRAKFLTLGAWSLAGQLVLPFASFADQIEMEREKKIDVIIIGGSYAGLSAAMSLGRSLRDVLIIDSGLPCNRQAPHSHNFLTQDGERPHLLAAEAREQVIQYPTVKFIQAIAIDVRKTQSGFLVSVQTGETFLGQKLLFATGLKDMMPDIPGFADCWGISVIHCPYCHGYEVRNRITGIMANGERAYHLARLVGNLTKNLVILTNGEAGFDFLQSTKLKANSIEIVDKEIKGISHENGYVREIHFKDGSSLNFQAVYAAVPFKQHSDLPVSLGCELTEFGHIKVDSYYKTTVDDVYACGDNSAMMRSIANAVAAGNMAGAVINKHITDEKF